MRKLRNTKKDKKVVVTTKEQLKAAVNRKEPVIEVQGDLAKKLQWLGKLSKAKISALIVALGAITAISVGTGGTAAAGGVSAAAIAPIISKKMGEIAGKEIAGVILACGISIALILAILKGYTAELEYNNVILRLKTPA